MPSPPNFLGVKMIFLENLCLFPLINLMMIFSISSMISFLGRGRAVARWVNFDKRHVLVMLTFAVVVSLMVDQENISSLTEFIALCQLMSKCPYIH